MKSRNAGIPCIQGRKLYEEIRYFKSCHIVAKGALPLWDPRPHPGLGRPQEKNSEKNICFPWKNCFSSGNKSSPQSFSAPGIMFPARRNIYSLFAMRYPVGSLFDWNEKKVLDSLTNFENSGHSGEVGRRQTRLITK